MKLEPLPLSLNTHVFIVQEHIVKKRYVTCLLVCVFTPVRQFPLIQFNPVGKPYLNTVNLYTIKPQTLGWDSFRHELLFEFTFANSRGGFLSKMDAAKIEIDNSKTMSKTTVQNFQSGYVIKCQLIFRTKANCIIFCLEKNLMSFFSRMTFANF